MIKVRTSHDRGKADYGWLEARYSFSFANYYDPNFMQFGHLRVLNEDRIAPGQGFPSHSHEDMEIVTYVVSGALAHQDSMGNGSTIHPGEVQLMSAGQGVTHSEYNASKVDELHLLQMWIKPDQRGVAPRYEQKDFSASDQKSALTLAVSPQGRDGSLSIGQDASLYLGHHEAKAETTLALKDSHKTWVQVINGTLKVNEDKLSAGDGAAITDESQLIFRSPNAAEFIIWTMPMKGSNGHE